jgi:transcriptional regulator with XRE-family HTH domain
LDRIGGKVRTIKELREAARLTQLEVAFRLGVQPSTVSAWERGLKEPRATHLRGLAQAFGVSADDIDLSAFEGKAAA